MLAASTRSLSVRRITAKMSAQGVLMTKAGKDGAQGDCPFTQYAAMSMQLAGKTYKLQPTPQAQKPAWHVDAHGGSMPCWAPNGFADGTDAIADSGGIAKVAQPAFGRYGASNDMQWEASMNDNINKLAVLILIC